MARRKGLKRWDEITTEGWLSLMADKTVMSALMMQIFSRLYHSEDYMDNAKNIAKALHLEYRALNAGVGWAGNKIREMYESGGLLTYHASEKKDETPREENFVFPKRPPLVSAARHGSMFSMGVRTITVPISGC